MARRRSAPNIFWEGLEELARDPLGWLDVDRPSYLRGAGSAGWSPRRGGRGLGDGVVSRTYGKRSPKIFSKPELKRIFLTLFFLTSVRRNSNFQSNC